MQETETSKRNSTHICLASVFVHKPLDQSVKNAVRLDELDISFPRESLVKYDCRKMGR